MLMKRVRTYMLSIPCLQLPLGIAVRTRTRLRGRVVLAENDERCERGCKALCLGTLGVHYGFKCVIRLNCLRKIIFQCFT